MDNYYRNRFCPCLRCRMNSMMGPAVLVTLGVMFLLNNLGVARGGTFVAVLLIVIGGVKLLQTGASTEGHRQPTYFYPQGPAPNQAPATPPPAPQNEAPTGQVNNG
jgi:hypothetical protein